MICRTNVLAASELMQRYPAFRLPPHFVGVVQPDGGFVEAEASIHAMLALAREERRGDSQRRDRPRGRAARQAACAS